MVECSILESSGVAMLRMVTVLRSIVYDTLWNGFDHEAAKLVRYAARLFA